MLKLELKPTYAFGRQAIFLMVAWRLKISGSNGPKVRRGTNKGC
jgi:hypothetical protein